MSGHSKWAGIKHKKAVVDAKRGQAFTKASREISIAAREAGGDQTSNFRLRLAVQKAREVNMPADKIQNAIDRGTGAGKGETWEELRYEGFGPSGVALLVDVVTDNRNRTAPQIRHLFSKYGGNLGEANSVGWMFERKGVLSVTLGDQDSEEIELAAIEAGAEDIREDEGTLEIVTEPPAFEDVRTALEGRGVAIESAEVTMQPKQTIPVEEDRAAAVLRLIEVLEEEDDVQQVHANFDIPADVLERVSASV
ncbi:MAG: YebC/PmpR family DNA-binding transcriptional regulator [Candidatus Dormibacteraeota bacterium]|nr:YebC/PmpR family DNA-binding transcriptional regulator [Candidatus Dormibacteraeota bacterium]MBO0704959.1 YebC/PmpR family DNA-binding transcriptional regulator [Candidatus Dormibacteraeota bacterium]MBO0760893.1 YebC/PmpR family DNA-binding transcriptional regulator [Candidatus Dormibacteraeota bacterium]